MQAIKSWRQGRPGNEPGIYLAGKVLIKLSVLCHWHLCVKTVVEMESRKLLKPVMFVSLYTILRVSVRVVYLRVSSDCVKVTGRQKLRI